MADVRRDSRAEYAFGTESLGFGGFEVADFHGVEEISRPYRFAVTLVRDAALEPVDLDSLVGAPATLAIGGAEEKGFFLRHGIVVEAEEIERTATSALYRAVLGPPIERARHRRRCRTFFDRTLESIVNHVLRGGRDGLQLLATPSREEELVASLDDYTAPAAGIAWNVNDAQTIARVQHLACGRTRCSTTSPISTSCGEAPRVPRGSRTSSSTRRRG